MLTILYDKVLRASTISTLYATVASVCALCTLGVMIGAAQPDREMAVDTLNGPTPGTLTELGNTPLAVAYRILEFFGLPSDWVHAPADYLAHDPERASGIGLGALLLGCMASVFCGERADAVATRPASTLWVCLTICMQLGAGWFWSLVLMTIAISAGKGLTSRDSGAFVWAVADIMLGALAFIAPAFILVDPSPPRPRNDPEVGSNP